MVYILIFLDCGSFNVSCLCQNILSVHFIGHCWLVHGWSTFGAQTHYGHTWIHKIHYGLD